jgi:hypothetical protein
MSNNRLNRPTNWWSDFAQQPQQPQNATWVNAQGQTCQVVCTGGSETPQQPLPPIVGMRLDFARIFFPNIRVVEQDGNPLPVTMDYRPDRINVATSDGIITRVVNFG